VRTLVQREMEAALARFDALLSPAAPTPAYVIGEKATNPLEMYKGDVMTVNLNLAGLPAVVLPCGFSDAPGGGRLPVGMQLAGRMFGEADLLALAHAFEQTAGALTAGPGPAVSAELAAAGARR
jgi:aspartyl-tRNA(Asn)/glutamyl-tRNA(Gln) amidotransferase subunit A